MKKNIKNQEGLVVMSFQDLPMIEKIRYGYLFPSKTQSLTPQVVIRLTTGEKSGTVVKKSIGNCVSIDSIMAKRSK